MRLRILIIILLFWLKLNPASAQTPGLDLCIREFEDANQNSQYDTGEPGFTGIGVFVWRGEEIIGSLTTTPDQDCLLTLTPGDYRVEFAADNIRPTTPVSVNVTLVNQTVTVDFGILPPQTTPNNEICYLVFQDDNNNRARESTEALLAGIDANLMVNDVIIEAAVSVADDYTCFTDLPPGFYRLVIPPNPNHILKNRNDATWDIQSTGFRVTADFAATRLDPFSSSAILPSYVPDENRFTLDQEMRILVSFLGSAIAMLFMLGMGAIILGFLKR